MQSAQLLALAVALGVSVYAIKKYLDKGGSKSSLINATNKSPENELMKMKLRSLDSSMIRGAKDIDPHLLIEFNDGNRYKFFNVPHNIKNDLMEADSHGKFFAQNIKDKYKFEKVSRLQHILSERTS
jgi:hypothetical protein